MFSFIKTIFQIDSLTKLILIVIFAASVLFSSKILWASNSKLQMVRQFKEESKQIDQKIQETSLKIESVQLEEKTVMDQLNETDSSIQDIKGVISFLRAELDSLEKQLQKTVSLSEEVKREIHDIESYAMKRMTSLYKHINAGKMMYLSLPESLYDYLYQKKAMNRILENDEQVLERLSRNLAGFETLQQQLHSIKKEKNELEAEYLKQLQRISYQKSLRSKILSDIRNKKNLMLASIESLKNSANQLDQKIIDLQKQSLSTQDDFKKDIKKPLKNLPNLPVKGKIISFFGPYKNPEYNVMNFQSGIVIRAERGEPIQAAESGTVIYSNWFKGYGNMIILDHGDNYYTVYAYLEDILINNNDRLEKGDVIGTVGDSGSLVGPALHFEVRHHGKPIDPVKWLKKGAKG